MRNARGRAMNPHLFVYGTLLSGARHPQGARLRREARLVGEASIAGRLYSLGRYPGLAEPSGIGDVVHGELYELARPRVALAWLDAYEGIGRDAVCEYERVERPVRLADGSDVLAWVYLYRASLAGRRQIAGGRWQAAGA